MSQDHIDNVILTKLKKTIRIKHVIYFLVFFAAVVFTFSIADGVLFILSYVFGFMLFYFILKFKEKLFGLILQTTPATNLLDSAKILSVHCNVCGGDKCSRFSKNGCNEPWNNLFVHKQLDQSIENFYNTILKTFITPWYSKLTQEDALLVELRFLLRYASSSLLHKALKVNIGQLITEKLIPCALQHYAICDEAHRLMKEKGLKNLEEAALEGPLRYSLHPALANRECELEYLRCITEAIIPNLLPKQEAESKLFSILIREIFAGWVLLSLTDILADPNIINTLVILATGDEKMSRLPEFPNHQVEFLENFVKNNSYKRMRLLSLDISEILKNPEYLYSFMQFMKSRGKINILQFCLDIDEFNKKMLQPEMNTSEQDALYKRANELYNTYFSHESLSFISFGNEYVKQFKSILDEGPTNIMQLQRSRVIYEAYDYVFGLIDNEWAPRFFDSKEFYEIVVPNTNLDPKKNTSNAKSDKGSSSAMGKPLSKLKDAFKSHAIDGQLLDINDPSNKMANDIDSVEGSDLEMQYSDILANYARLKNKDMGTWRVSIDEVIEKKANNKTGILHWFVINIQKIDPHGMGEDSQWAVERNDRDFYILRNKLIEFHGEALLGNANIPSKRLKVAPKVRQVKYETFLQRLLMIPLLRSSDLLHMFLTADADFSSLAEKARSDSSGSLDIGSLYQTVTHKLRKEKGQHLDIFLQTFLISTDLGYYQSLNEEKKKYNDCEEEAMDVMNDISLTSSKKKDNSRCLTNGVFGNNFGLQCSIESIVLPNKNNAVKWNFTQCLFFILSDVFKIHRCVFNITESICQIGDPYINYYFDKFLNSILCKVLSPPRLGHLIKLGQDLLFNNHIPTSVKMNRETKRKVAKSNLQTAFPFLLSKLMGPNFLIGVDTLFEFLQNPRLNKQLVYSLLDIILIELFPDIEEKS